MKAKNLLIVPVLCMAVGSLYGLYGYVFHSQDSNAQVVMNLPEIDKVKLMKNLSVYNGSSVAESMDAGSSSEVVVTESVEPDIGVYAAPAATEISSAFDGISVVNNKEIKYKANDFDFGTKGCIIRDRKFKVILTVPLFEGMKQKALLDSVAVFSDSKGENTVTYYLNGQSLLEATDSVHDVYTVYSGVYDSVEVGIQKRVSYGDIDFVYYKITYQDDGEQKVFYYCIVDLNSHSLVVEIEGLQKSLKEKSIVGAFNLKIDSAEPDSVVTTESDSLQDSAVDPLD